MRAAALPRPLPRLRTVAGLAGLAAMLAACTPALVPVEQAERSCAAEVQSHAMHAEPRVSMGVAIGSGGRVRPHAGLSVSMSPDRVAPVDTAEAFNRCVMRRSGQMPTRPLAGQPGMQG